MTDPLSLDRIHLALETLRAAYRESAGGKMGRTYIPAPGDEERFFGAVDADPTGAFSEARRNLIAFIQWRYGDEEWEKTMEDGW